MLYELICSVNQRIIMGKNVGEEEKQQVIDAILSEPDFTHFIISVLLDKLFRIIADSGESSSPKFMDSNEKREECSPNSPRFCLLSDSTVLFLKGFQPPRNAGGSRISWECCLAFKKENLLEGG